MNLINSIGNAMVKRGEALLMKGYEKQFGRQLGTVSRNGNKAFSKFVGNNEIVTGLDRQGNVISKITREVGEVHNNIGSGTVHTERFRDGKLTSVTDTRLATNYRNSLTHYADGSAVYRIWDCPNGVAELKTLTIPSVYTKGSDAPVLTRKSFNV